MYQPAGRTADHDFVSVVVVKRRSRTNQPNQALIDRILLRLCDEFAKDYFVTFNAKKTKCIYYSSIHCSGTHDDKAKLMPEFFVNGNVMEYVQNWPHLGHILNAELDDNDDIEHRRIQTVKQINDVLCYFGKLDAIIKLNLL
jgi:hypothetical protein